MRSASQDITIGRIDSGLGFESGRPDIQSRNVVSVASESTRLTYKFISGLSVCFGNMATSRTSLAGIGRVNSNHGDAAQLSLVLDIGAELCELPIMQVSTLAATGLNTFTKVLEVFKGDRRTIALRRLDNALGYAMIPVFLKLCLFPANLLQLAFSRIRSFLLKILSTVVKYLDILLNTFTTVIVPSRVGSEIHDTEVNTKDIRSLDNIGFINIADAGDIPLTFYEHQVNFTLAERQHLPLVVAEFSSNLLSASHSPDGYYVVATESKNAVIIRLRRMVTKFMATGFVNFVCIGNFGNTAYRNLSRKLELCSDIVVSKLVKIVLPEYLCRPAGLRQIVTGSITGLKRCQQQLVLFCRRAEFYVHYQLHISSIEYLLTFVNHFININRRARFLPRLKIVGFLARKIMKNLLTLLIVMMTLTLSAADKPKDGKWQKYIIGSNPAVSTADADRIIAAVYDHCGWPYIVFPLIKRESSFISTAKGKGGEIGLMQVQPKIHGDVSDNPEYQIIQGCQVLDAYINEILKAKPELRKDGEGLKQAALDAYKLGITRYLKK